MSLNHRSLPELLNSTMLTYSFLRICLCHLKHFLLFGCIPEKQLDEPTLTGCWPGWRAHKGTHLDSPPLEGAVCSGFAACQQCFFQSTFQWATPHSRAWHQASSPPSYRGVFEQNPAPALSLINGHIQHHYSCKCHRIVPSVDAAFPPYICLITASKLRKLLCLVPFKKNDVNKVDATDSGIQVPL